MGWEDPLEKGKVTHSSILAERIPWIAKTPWVAKKFSRQEYWGHNVIVLRDKEKLNNHSRLKEMKEI